VTTGLCQLFYYVRTLDHAYDSLNYLRTEVPFGWLIHSLHHWGANAIVLLVGLHMCRVFILHTAILPGLLIGLTGIHLTAFRCIGVVGPWDETRRQQSGPFWPDQVFDDTVIASLLVFILIVLAVFVRAPITGPADPPGTSHIPKLEWNFLFLNEG
jgi:quinol-cytochrome oxidoreductase complex cytochrome b subunit